jgi:hypothetical protein
VRGIDRRAAAMILAVAVVSWPRLSDASDGHALRAGAVEVGASGSFTSVEGTSSAALGLHAGYFVPVARERLRLRLGCAYSRVSELDRLDFFAAAHLLHRVASSSAYPYVGAVAGLRQEWIGSFSQSRYPVGFDAGMTALLGASAAFGVAYEFRRSLDDPVSDYNEHRVVFGLSVLFRNE